MSRFRSIKSTLLIWFLIIALVPTVMIGWYGYYTAATSIQDLQNSKLDATAHTNVQYVSDWFEETNRDLISWAGLPELQDAYKGIVKGWNTSGLSLADYAKTSEYSKITADAKLALNNLEKNYGYVHDIMMIDSEGNILFSVQHEADFTTNLREGKYADTLFARAFRSTLIDEKSHFSDLEPYAPSNHALSGFITTPIRDNAGKVIGVMALQLHMETLFNRLEHNSENDTRIEHYLVGPDGMLRSMRKMHPILSERISTEQFWKWQNEDESRFIDAHQPVTEAVFSYRGPDGSEVIGKHCNIAILGVNWVHISEISADDAMAPSLKLAKMIVLMLFVGIGVIVGAATMLSRRITYPILALREASNAFKAGDKEVALQVESHDEIGELTFAFSEMIDQQRKDTMELSERAASERAKSEELQQALAETNRLSQVVNQTPYAIVITDCDGMIEYINEAVLMLSGYERGELISQKTSIFRSGKQGVALYQSLWDTISVEHKVWRGTLINRMKDGRLRDWYSTIFPLFDMHNNITNYVSIINDVTEINAKDRLLLLQSRQAQMGEMLSMIAHQWRQPLAIINALVGKILLNDMMKSEQDAVLAENLKLIEDQSLFLSRTITDFRDFFRTDKPKEMIACSLLVKNALSLVDHAIKTHSLHLNTILLSDPLISTYANEVLQVLITLIKNSLDAFEETKLANKTIEITIDQYQNDAIIKVKDNAGGIKHEMIEEIFLPYFTTKKGDKGTGLGLYMGKMVIEDHCRGKLSVVSEGEMTTFTIALPMEKTEKINTES